VDILGLLVVSVAAVSVTWTLQRLRAPLLLQVFGGLASVVAAITLIEIIVEDTHPSRMIAFWKLVLPALLLIALAIWLKLRLLGRNR